MHQEIGKTSMSQALHQASIAGALRLPELPNYNSAVLSQGT
jgi:hypothetical protein